jgi:hypothetical protein
MNSGLWLQPFLFVISSGAYPAVDPHTIEDFHYNETDILQTHKPFDPFLQNPPDPPVPSALCLL